MPMLSTFAELLTKHYVKTGELLYTVPLTCFVPQTTFTVSILDYNN